MRFLPVGARALLVEVDGLDAALALHVEVVRRRAEGWRPGLLDVIPAARTVLFDGVDDPDGLAGELAGWSVPPIPAIRGEAVDIACRYDGADLAEIASYWGVDRDEAVRIHTGLVHRVAFCGFAPGFAYIAGLGDRYSVPRRRHPRTAVPIGSVAIGGTYTGIYPRVSPGGWRLMGTTEAALWDPARHPPALLVPGTQVHFVDAG